MARSTTSSSGRSKITSPSKDLLLDDGSFLISVVNGEQLHLEFTLNWLISLASITVTAKVVEGDNTNLGTKPTAAASNPAVITLPLLDSEPTDNIIKVVIPADLISTWGHSPEPGKPVYGFFGIEVADGESGNDQQIWKPVRGMVEVLYSPTEVS